MGSQQAAQIPTSFGHELRACLRCRLVKTYDQARSVPGCYTLAVSEALPEDLQNLCQDERIPYNPPKRI